MCTVTLLVHSLTLIVIALSLWRWVFPALSTFVGDDPESKDVACVSALCESCMVERHQVPDSMFPPHLPNPRLEADQRTRQKDCWPVGRAAKQQGKERKKATPAEGRRELRKGGR